MLSVIQNGEVFTFDEADNGLDITHTFFIHDGVAHVDGVIVKDDGSDGGVPNPFPEPFPAHLFDSMRDCHYMAETDGMSEAGAAPVVVVVAEPVVTADPPAPVAEPAVEPAAVAAEPVVAAEPAAPAPAPAPAPAAVVAEPAVTPPAENFTGVDMVTGTDTVQYAQSGQSTVVPVDDGLLIADDDGNTFSYSGDPGSELVLIGTPPEAAA